MSITSAPTFDQTLALARRLSPQDRATLIAQLAHELVTPAAPAQAAADDVNPWQRLAELRAHFAALGSVTPTAGEQLEIDRRERDEALRGTTEADHVHA
ncbi:MAG: hypothetical protein WCG26_13830 [Chloroflexales bacterium]